MSRSVVPIDPTDVLDERGSPAMIAAYLVDEVPGSLGALIIEANGRYRIVDVTKLKSTVEYDHKNEKWVDTLEVARERMAREQESLR